MVIEGRGADHDDRYRTGERSGLLSNFTALEPTEQRIGLTARIFEYRASLDEIVEVARRCRRLDLMDVDQPTARIVDGARVDEAIDALHGIDLGFVADREPHLGVPVLHVEIALRPHVARPTIGERPADDHTIEIVQLGHYARAMIGTVHLPVGNVGEAIERQPQRGLDSPRRDSEDGLLSSTWFGDAWIAALLVGHDTNAGFGLHPLACRIITEEDALAGRGIIGVKEDADVAFISRCGFY